MDALEMSAKKKIKVVVSEEISIDQINEAYERIKEKKNVGRVFIKF